MKIGNRLYGPLDTEGPALERFYQESTTNLPASAGSTLSNMRTCAFPHGTEKTFPLKVFAMRAQALREGPPMVTAGYLRLFAAILTGAASLNQVASAATLATDGLYSVDITTRQGDCDKVYHWKISVSGGRVSSVGATLMAASGKISGSGDVDLAFRGFGQVATGTGRFASGSGSGSWSSPTLNCAGSWRAVRQG
jgi:hypothetical protein